MIINGLMTGNSFKRTRFDLWLAGLCLSRVCTCFIFMTYPGALSVLCEEWGMSGAQAGAVATAFQVGYAVSLVVFSAAADRVGSKRLYLCSMFVSGISALGFAFFARDFTSGLVLHTLVGITLGGTYTTGIMVIADQYAATSRGMAVGLFIASSSLGYACSLGISGATLPIGGYRLSFLLTCMGPLAGWLLGWLTLRKTEIALPVRATARPIIREIVKNRRAMLLIWGYSFHNWELQGMWAWTPAFMAACIGLAGAASITAAASGAGMVAIFHVVGLLSCFSMGTLSDRLGRRRVIVVLAVTSMLCSFLFGWSYRLAPGRRRGLCLLGTGRFPRFFGGPDRSSGPCVSRKRPRLEVAPGLRHCRNRAPGLRRSTRFREACRRAARLHCLGLGLRYAGSGRTRGRDCRPQVRQARAGCEREHRAGRKYRTVPPSLRTGRPTVMSSGAYPKSTLLSIPAM